VKTVTNLRKTSKCLSKSSNKSLP